MWYPAKVTQAPTTEVVSKDDAKRQCHIDFDDEDGQIDMLIAAAVGHAEKVCGSRFSAQTVEIKCDRFADFCRLPEAPLKSISVITYRDGAGATKTLAEDAYELRADGLEASIVLPFGRSWPVTLTGSRITVTAVVGYDEPPAEVKHAILKMIFDGFEDRENKPDAAWSVVDSLLCNHKRGA